ncbi:hypothetical protein SG34_029945 [Thalassomonas viridans]|uniref:Uncharacterized protein n=1 Tax=Thalassomonas viridans TaxID=137584 RepID=A0AAE9ZAW6_9GAMM|nr:hypothetical protein [Thalassomonas viridans]WDE09005.1 hypothetical protein SG34_029945 [Thalassomonas viridans]
MAKLALIFLGVCYAVVSKNPLHVSIIINVSLVLIMLMNRRNINVVHLCGALLTVYIIEMLLFEFVVIIERGRMSPMWLNASIYATHFVIDLMLFILVALRAPFTRGRLAAQGKPYDHVFIYNSEFGLKSLFIVFMLVDLLALVENFIRHLDEFGLSDNIAQLFSNLTIVYYSYSPVKFVLLGITFLLIWSMTTDVGKEEYKKKIKA